MKHYHPPKLSMEVANELRDRYMEGESINSLSKRYSLSRPSVKGILKGHTYNKYGIYGDLMQQKHPALF